MSLEIKVKLTTEDILYGMDKEPSYCPVARALSRDASNLGGWWEVTPQFLFWHRTETNSLSWHTPYKVSKWIKNFDKYGGNDRGGWRRKLLGSRFPAITFSLDLPEFSTLRTRSENEAKEIQVSIARRAEG